MISPEYVPVVYGIIKLFSDNGIKIMEKDKIFNITSEIMLCRDVATVDDLSLILNWQSPGYQYCINDRDKRSKSR